MRILLHLLVAGLIAGLGGNQQAAEPGLRDQAEQALRRAVEFYRTRAASHGGYVYRYSSDLTLREGEGKVDADTAWVQPPGTPAVGMALLEAHERTGAAYLLDAARAAGECLIQGQLRSGGWTASVEFNPEKRRRFAYRVDPPRPKGFNVTTLDDDKTQSASRLLIRLDQALGRRDGPLHEASRFVLDSILKAQFPNGAWPQGYGELPDHSRHPVKRAGYPETWAKNCPGGRYWELYTFNDNAVVDTIDLLFLAGEAYGEERYRRAALRAGEFILLAQMPEPQPAWAQQYDADMHPAWARKFEPPAVSGGESQGIIEVLLRLYVESGEHKFLEAVPRALTYLERSRLPDGRLARFYELRTNKPLYFTRRYELTYEDNDLPTHYAFKVSSRLDALRRRYDELAQAAPEKLAQLRRRTNQPVELTPGLEAEVRSVIAALDERGAWVEDGRLRHHGADNEVRRIIDSRTFIRNVGVLSKYLSASRNR